MHDFSANTDAATCRSELSGRTWTLLTEKYLGPASRLLAPGFDLKAICLIAALSTLIIVGTILPLIISDERLLPRSVTEQAIGLVIALMTLLGHELGHAAAASRYGHQPLEVGLTLHRHMLPALFVDIEYRESPSRNEVIRIALAGCMAQLPLPHRETTSCCEWLGKCMVYDAAGLATSDPEQTRIQARSVCLTRLISRVCST